MALSPGSEISAVGVYAWFHLSALQKATRLATEPLAPAERQALARAMLADEGFALHFLEDTYAAGHVAGAWGDVSQRKGTHDYYNEAGLEVFTWKGSSESMVLMGDAHMRPQDAERAARAVTVSLQQLIDHATGRELAPRACRTLRPRLASPTLSTSARTTCSKRREEGLRATPRGLCADSRGARPDARARASARGWGRCRAFAPRWGRSSASSAPGTCASISGGYDPSVTSNGWIGGADLSLRAGLGLDGVIGESGDGLVFGSIGVRGDTRSSNTLAA